MLGTQVNALIVFLPREALALTKASSFPIAINSSIFRKHVSNARGSPWGTLMPSPPGRDKICECPIPRADSVSMGTAGIDCCIMSADNRPRSIYINILTWLRGFRVKLLYLVLFSLYSSLFWELRDKRSLKNLQFWPESLGATLEYWYIERGLLSKHIFAPNGGWVNSTNTILVSRGRAPFGQHQECANTRRERRERGLIEDVTNIRLLLYLFRYQSDKANDVAVHCLEKKKQSLRSNPLSKKLLLHRILSGEKCKESKEISYISLQSSKSSFRKNRSSNFQIPHFRCFSLSRLPRGGIWLLWYILDHFSTGLSLPWHTFCLVSFHKVQ